jgi:hypothetical protein
MIPELQPTDANPAQESKSKPAAPDRLQFSLASIFFVTIALAVILSIYFSVGKLLGISTLQVLWLGSGSSIFSFPIVLIWIVGFAVAIRRRKCNRMPALLTMIALGSLIAISFVPIVVQILLRQLISGFGLGVYSTIYLGVSVVSTVIYAAAWIVILTAVFWQRSADVSQSTCPIPPRSEFTNSDDALAVAFHLDMKGDWDAALALYGEITRRWPEQGDYARGCIERVEEKRSRVNQR